MSPMPGSTSDSTPATAPDRRAVLRGTAAAAVTAVTGFPFIVRSRGPITLRMGGSGVIAFPEVAERAERDTGVRLEFENVTSDAQVRALATRDDPFDIFQGEYWMASRLVQGGRLQAIDAERIRHFDKVLPIYTEGRIGEHTMGRQGIAPVSVQFVDDRRGRQAGDRPTRWLSLLPLACNADTLGVRPDLTGRPITHWRFLLDPDYRGRAALIDVPAIGIMDAAMAIESRGDLTYGDKGNMTAAEIDTTIAILTELKRDGHFHTLWRDFPESVRLMAGGSVVIQSMWENAVGQVRAAGFPCDYPALAEGFRGWGIGIGLSLSLDGEKLDAAYEVMNWFLDGWAGAFFNRQGYYPSVPETARAYSEDYEWDYWVNGLPAENPIRGPDGRQVVPPGHRRAGGSLEERMGRVACWNTIMDEHRYLIRRWNEFVAA